MSHFLLILNAHHDNSRLLSQWLETRYQTIAVINPELTSHENFNTLIAQHFDLCILDVATINKFADQIQAKKDLEKDILLPFLLLAAREDIAAIAPDLFKIIDEIIFTPIEKIELLLRVEKSLQIRRLSIANQALVNLNAAKSNFIYATADKFRCILTHFSLCIRMLQEHGDEISPKSKLRYSQYIVENLQ